MPDDHTSHIHSTTNHPDRETSDGRFQTLKAAIVSSAHGFHDMYAGFFAPLLPYLIERLSLLKFQAGMFLLLYQGASILQPIIGHIGDRKNLRKYALLMPGITGIALSLLGIAPTFQIALLLCLIAGISSATMHSLLPALVSSLSGDNVGKGMSFWMVGGELGVMLGPLLITLIINTISIQATPWLMVFGISMSIVLSFLLKDVTHHKTEVQTSEKLPLRKFMAILIPLFAIILMRAPMRACIDLYMPVYLIEKGVSPWLAGTSTSLLLAFGVLGTITGGYLNDNFGHRLVIVVSLIFSAVGLVLFIHTTNFFQVASIAIVGAASMMLLPVGMAVVQKSFPNNRSLANGLYLAQFFVINAISSVFTGFLYDQFGGFNTFLWSGFISLVGIPFVFLLPKKVEDQTI